MDQFVAASARLAPHVPIERRADWLVMVDAAGAAALAPAVPGDAGAAEATEREAEREVARTDELRFIRATASWLRGRPQLGHDVFADASPGPDPLVASYMALMEACLTVLRGREKQPDEEAVYRPRIADLFRIPEALFRMRALVATMIEPGPLEDFLPIIPVERRDQHRRPLRHGVDRLRRR